MFDISWLADDHLRDDDEPVFLSIAPAPLPDRMAAMIARYERRLGRKLNPNEGQVLTHAHFELDPQRLGPRFTQCAACGEWIDRGPLKQRMVGDNRALCDYCKIPF